ncbi:MAG: antibiotic biosynthesis monooxygenase [Bacteroidia bacterium]|nr:antibiotic biosynthesis monooxygenase [Bacteroidia bacterium]
MITRLVKMHFRPDETENFIQLFESVKDKISAMEGCLGVDLLRDINSPDIFFTYSHWDSEKHLNAYRDSELFGITWKNTKSKFAHKAEAWSVEQLVGTLNNILK